MENRTHSDTTIHANKRIIDTLQEIQDIRESVAELKKQDDRLKRHLKLLLHDASLVVDKKGYTLATWAEYDVRRLDKASLKETYPDIYKSFVKTYLEKKLKIYMKRR